MALIPTQPFRKVAGTSWPPACVRHVSMRSGNGRGPEAPGLGNEPAQGAIAYDSLDCWAPTTGYLHVANQGLSVAESQSRCKVNPADGLA